MNELLEPVSKTYPLKKVKEVIFLNTGDIQNGKFLHSLKSEPSTLPGQAKKSISKSDILYSEIRPINKRFAYVYFDAPDYVVSTKLMVLRSAAEIDSLFQYFILTQQEQIEYLQHLAESRSGTFPQITFSELSTIKIALPRFDMVNEFVNNVLKPYFDNQFNLDKENEVLSKLRDTLLPKLISGELEVSEALNEKIK
jgi:type I restriction enzyme S subunit